MAGRLGWAGGALQARAGTWASLGLVPAAPCELCLPACMGRVALPLPLPQRRHRR